MYVCMAFTPVRPRSCIVSTCVMTSVCVYFLHGFILKAFSPGKHACSRGFTVAYVCLLVCIYVCMYKHIYPYIKTCMNWSGSSVSTSAHTHVYNTYATGMARLYPLLHTHIYNIHIFIHIYIYNIHIFIHTCNRNGSSVSTSGHTHSDGLTRTPSTCSLSRVSSTSGVCAYVACVYVYVSTCKYIYGPGLHQLVLSVESHLHQLCVCMYM
jgi:hypothetical protein